MFVFPVVRVLFGLAHIHRGSGAGGATHQRSQVMTHPQLNESSSAIPGVRQLFPEVRPGCASYFPAERRSPAASLDGGGGEGV